MEQVGDDFFNEVEFNSWPTAPFDPVLPFALGATITIEGFDETKVALNGIFTVTGVTPPTVPAVAGTPNTTKVKYLTTASELLTVDPADLAGVTITGEIVGGPMSETGR